MDGKVTQEINTLREQLVELQTQVSFQEATIAELNSALSQQQQDLVDIKRHWELLSERYRDLQAQLPDAPGEEPPPPHY